MLRRRAHYSPRLGFSQLDTIIYGSETGEVGQPAMARGTDLDGDGCADVLINDASHIESIGGTPQ